MGQLEATYGAGWGRACVGTPTPWDDPYMPGPSVKHDTEMRDCLVRPARLPSAILGATAIAQWGLEFGLPTDSEALGRLARMAGVKTLMLTHLIPPPDRIERGEERYTEAVRRGGFEGEIVVGTDLASVDLG